VFGLLFAVFQCLYRKSQLLRKICSPIRALFSQFLELHDLSEYNAFLRNVPPSWKRQSLLYLTALQCLAWLASLAYELETRPHSAESWFLAVNVLTWVGNMHVYWYRSTSAHDMLVPLIPCALYPPYQYRSISSGSLLWPAHDFRGCRPVFRRECIIPRSSHPDCQPPWGHVSIHSRCPSDLDSWLATTT
jgi:hypothetical protein